MRENTVAAFEAAVAVGAAGIELDVRRTADGRLVVHHDAALGDGRAIVSLRRDELPAYVPSLDEALDACDGAWVNVEIKNSPLEPDFDPTGAVADAVVDALLARPEPVANWLVSSFSAETVDRIAARGDRPRTALLTGHALSADELVALAQRGHAALHPWDPTVDADLVRRAHDAGIEVNVWTVNDVARAVELAAMGVDGLCTDDPVAVATALRA